MLFDTVSFTGVATSSLRRRSGRATGRRCRSASIVMSTSPLRPASCALLVRKGLKSWIERPDPLVAPLQQGETVGRVLVSSAGRRVAEVPVVALERVQSGGLLRRARCACAVVEEAQ